MPSHILQIDNFGWLCEKKRPKSFCIWLNWAFAHRDHDLFFANLQAEQSASNHANQCSRDYCAQRVPFFHAILSGKARTPVILSSKKTACACNGAMANDF